MDEKALPEQYRKVFDIVRSADEPPLMTQDVCRLPMLVKRLVPSTTTPSSGRSRRPS